VLFGFAVLLVYVYAFVGGFTDAANAIATSVGARVLSPRAAVAVAGGFNLLGGLTGTAVALTIGRGLVDPAVLSLATVVAALLGTMAWSLLTYRLGIPVSETHGLIGGLVGAGVATAGPGVIQWQGLTKTLMAIVASPTLGFLGGVALIVAIYRILFHRRRGRIIPVFKHLQRASAAYMAFSHGRNDAQKPMGMLAVAIALHFGAPDVSVPTWIVVSCALVAAIGTAYGGWRIIRTLGLRITVLDPVQGFAAETAAARRSWASRSARRTLSPRRSWASAWHAGSRRSAGGSASTSCSPGCLSCLSRWRSAPARSSSSGRCCCSWPGSAVPEVATEAANS
jgi:inorganic phosphate transporter, PiT family